MFLSLFLLSKIVLTCDSDIEHLKLSETLLAAVRERKDARRKQGENQKKMKLAMQAIRREADRRPHYDSTGAAWRYKARDGRELNGRERI